MDNQNDILEELKIQTAWLRIVGLQAIKDLIKEEMKSKQDKRIYELSDGQRPTREIAKEVGSSHMKVALKWNKWASIGLVMPSEKYRGRFKKIVPLGDLGIK